MWFGHVHVRETHKPNTSGPVSFASREQHLVTPGLHTVIRAEECGFILVDLIIYFRCNNNRVMTDCD